MVETKVTKNSRKIMKHIPQRTCVGCKSVIAKRSLIRLVSRPDGVQIDPTGKLAGRGAYLHNQKLCWEKGLKGPVANALRTTLSEKDLNCLVQYMQQLPSGNDIQDQV